MERIDIDQNLIKINGMRDIPLGSGHLLHPDNQPQSKVFLIVGYRSVVDLRRHPEQRQGLEETDISIREEERELGRA